MKKNDKKIIMGVIAIGVLVVLALMIILWPKGGDPSLENSSGSTTSTQGTESSGTVTDPTQSTGETEPGVTDPTESQPAASDPADPTDPTEPAVTEPSGTDPVPTEPVPTDPPATAPEPTDPPATEPQPTEPAPTQPQPTEPQAHTHSYTRVVTAPTCTQEGYTTYTCSCGHSYKGSYEDPRHKWNNTEFAPTCTERGYVLSVCDICGLSDKGLWTAELGHSYGSWTTTKQPTQTEQGLQERVCATCGGHNTQVIPAIGAEIETYIDPRIVVNQNGEVTSYEYGYVRVRLFATWNVNLSIYINENDGYDITYYQQDGTRVDFTMDPIEGYRRAFTIKEDGTYVLNYNGGFDD